MALCSSRFEPNWRGATAAAALGLRVAAAAGRPAAPPGVLRFGQPWMGLRLLAKANRVVATSANPWPVFSCPLLLGVRDAHALLNTPPPPPSAFPVCICVGVCWCRTALGAGAGGAGAGAARGGASGQEVARGCPRGRRLQRPPPPPVKLCICPAVPCGCRPRWKCMLQPADAVPAPRQCCPFVLLHWLGCRGAPLMYESKCLPALPVCALLTVCACVASGRHAPRRRACLRGYWALPTPTPPRPTPGRIANPPLLPRAGAHAGRSGASGAGELGWPQRARARVRVVGGRGRRVCRAGRRRSGCKVDAMGQVVLASGWTGAVPPRGGSAPSPPPWSSLAFSCAHCTLHCPLHWPGLPCFL